MATVFQSRWFSLPLPSVLLSGQEGLLAALLYSEEGNPADYMTLFGAPLFFSFPPRFCPDYFLLTSGCFVFKKISFFQLF